MAQNRSIEEILTHIVNQTPCQGESSGMSPGFRAILGAYQNVPYWSEAGLEMKKNLPEPLDAGPMYNACSRLVSTLRYDKEDVETFTNKELPRIWKDKGRVLNPATGVFISALINYLPGPEEIYLKTGEIPKTGFLNHLGYQIGERHEHRLHISDLSADYIAEGMVQGEVHIGDICSKSLGKGMKGGYIEAPNCQIAAGEQMQGGEIYLKKHHITYFEGSPYACSSESVGDNMQGGKITIEGDATGIGSAMKGGEMHVTGSALFLGGLGGIHGGSVFIEGFATTIHQDLGEGNVVVKGELYRSIDY